MKTGEQLAIAIFDQDSEVGTSEIDTFKHMMVEKELRYLPKIV